MDDPNGSVTIPRWFLWIHGGTAPLLLTMVVAGVVILYEMKTQVSILNTRMEFIAKAGEERSTVIDRLRDNLRKVEVELAKLQKTISDTQ